MPKLVLRLLPVLAVALAGCSTVRQTPPAIPQTVVVPGASISEIHMLTADTGWALTSGQAGHSLLLRTVDGGESWSDATPGPAAHPGNAESGIYFFDAQNGWVSEIDDANAGAGLWHTRDGGKTWAYIATKELYRDFHFLDPNHGIACQADYGAGSADYRFFATADGGLNWDSVPIYVPVPDPDPGVPPGTLHLCNICPETATFLPPAKIIITHGDLGDEQPKDAVRLSLSTDLGKTWRDEALSLPSEKYNEGLVACDLPVFFDDKNGCLPVRLSKETDDHGAAYDILAIYATHDGGATWAPCPGIVGAAGNFPAEERQLDIVSARDMFVRAGPNLQATHDGAKTWQTIKSNIDLGPATTDRSVLQIDFADARHGWAIISDNFNQSPDGSACLYKTTDGGTRWARVPLKIVP